MTVKGVSPKLLEPGTIAGLRLNNRYIMSSMGTRLAGVWGEVNEATIEWYVKRARGGVGLVTVEATHAAAALYPVRGVIRMLRADDDCFSSGLFSLAEAVHKAGSKISVQLSVGKAAATGSQWMPGLGDLENLVGKGPSAVSFPDGVVPQELSVEEIQQTIAMFGKSASRVKSVGFDAIELHAHFHSIPGCFMSPLFNKRTDDYGGSFEKRLRFVSDVIASMREKVGPGFPLMIKYSIDEFLAGGRNLDDGLRIARHLEEIGVDAIVVSQGQAGSKQIPYAPFYRPEGYMVPLAEALKKTVDIPVIVGGRLGDPVKAAQVLADGKADFIGLGRPLIADPDLPIKVKQGRVREIRRCVSDNYCFEVFPKGEMRCALNVTAGREITFGEITPAGVKKKVVIVGAGPAGMEAARVAGIKGHQVTLFEKSDALSGGQLALAAATPQKDILHSISNYYAAIFQDLGNVDLRLGTQATVEAIVVENPDTVILATGGKSLVPDIPGIDGNNVVTAFDVLAGKIDVRGKNVVVCGGNAVGCETADYLAKKDNNVTIVEMFDAIARDVEFTQKFCLLDEMAQCSVNVITGTKIEAFSGDGVNLVDKQGQKTTLPMDIAVLALGVESVNDLAVDLAGKVDEVHVIGDAKSPARIHDAVSDAFYMTYYL